MWSCGPSLSDEETKLAELIDYHRKLRPGFEIQDAYKLLYQGNLGIEHIMGDTIAAKEYLDYEMASINAGEFPEEPLIENISTDSSIVRINLRPFKRLGLDATTLWRVMVVSSQSYPRINEKFLHSWKLCLALCEDGVLPFEPEKVRLFEDQMRNNHYRSSHHSNQYTDTYKPAYRVVLLNEFKKSFQISFN